MNVLQRLTLPCQPLQNILMWEGQQETNVKNLGNYGKISLICTHNRTRGCYSSGFATVGYCLSVCLSEDFF